MTLSTERLEILAAATARILPSEDGPGAAEAGVVDYIVEAMEDRSNRHFLPLLERGLDFLDALATDAGEEGFAGCDPSRQDEILREAQEYPNNDARRFFQRLVELTLEGFLCDPRHGGNQDRVGWSYVGFEPPAERPPWRAGGSA